MNIPSKWIKGVLAAVALLAFAATGYAQDASTGSISGTVKDSTGALIAGATVTITNTDRGAVQRTLVTNSSGFYTATSLPLGHYVVKIDEKGFKAETVTGIQLHVSDALTVNGALSAGSEGESVQVVAESQGVNLQDATSAGLINSTQINELVMVSRNYETLINLQPGVAFGGTTDQLQRGPIGVNGASSVVAFSVNGGRSTSNNWTIDGADNLDRGANLTLYVYPSSDSIGEFKTLRGQYSAANGRNSAGQVDVVTKSGTNSIHGTAYEYFRNDFMDAKTYIQDYLGQPITKYRYNDFGFSLGGPVFIPHLYDGKNKTFWFVSENWLKEITYTSGTTGVNIPTPAEVAGDFSSEWYLDGATGSPTKGQWIQGPVNVCTAFTTNSATQQNTCTAAGTKVTNMSPTAQAYLKDVYSKIPQNTPAQQQAYAARGIDPHSLYATLRNEYPNLDSVVRIDQQLGSHVTAFYRYVHDTFPEFIGAGTFTAVPIPGLSSTYSSAPGTQHLGKVTWTATPTIVANIGYAYSTGQIVTRPTGGMLQSASPDINIPEPYVNTSGIQPSIVVSGFQSITATPVYLDFGKDHEAFGDVTKVLGNHTFIAGIAYHHYNKVENSNANVQGSFNFTNDAGY
ncbi:MAG: carboxypeptidase-like regulatory domain-containing protein, partial [Acidobacteriota bacterium]